MRGVALIVAVTVVAEVGDFRRFANPLRTAVEKSSTVAAG
jgi:hypothetical protein